jgi:putative membrane protein
MRLMIAIIALSAVQFVNSGCGENSGDKIQNEADTLAAKVEEGMDKLGDKVDSMNIGGNKNADENFLSDAVEDNTMEIKALMIGKSKGGKEVKKSAGQMLSDHKALGEKVKDYVASHNIVLDGVDTAGIDNDLNNKAAGMDFDRSWADKMVNDHERVIKRFQDAQNDVKDSTLKTLITNALPKLKSHLEMSKQLRDKLNSDNNNKK